MAPNKLNINTTNIKVGYKCKTPYESMVKSVRLSVANFDFYRAMLPG